jgi:ubiquinone/menaquinone biosynthesis C-methylase UbiE
VVRKEGALFDEWPEQYDRWFESPLGAVVKACELALIMELLVPRPGEVILDAGSGTGVFTLPMLRAGAAVVGLDLSLPMIRRAVRKCASLSFSAVVGDMAGLPFRDGSFDKTVSITALEFIEDAPRAVGELFRVTRRGGLVVVATLNSESPWADRRRHEAGRKKTIFSNAFFRSPREMLSLAPFPGVVRTAVHFEKGVDPAAAMGAEEEGRKRGAATGAFVAVRWRKP